MNSAEEQFLEVQRFYPDAIIIPEGGVNYVFIPDLELPSGCVPQKIDALLCPVLKNGYQSRLFYTQKIEGIASRNWNGNLRLCDRTWVSFSWKSKDGMSLLEMMRYHLYTLTI